MSIPTPTEAVQAAIAEFDRCFAAGDAAALSETFAVDAQLLLLHREAIEGRPAIRAHWERLFGDWDPGAWQTEQRIVEVHAERAYVLSVYSETLVPRNGAVSLIVRGRLIRFLRRDSDGRWRVTLALNSHVRPVEEAP